MSKLKMFTILILMVAGCSGSGSGSGGSGSGPIDGSWLVATQKCNGVTATFPPTGLQSEEVIIQDTTGSFVAAYTDGCVSTEGDVFAYPSSGTFTDQKVNRVCSGNTTNCTANSECTASSTTGTLNTFTYTLSGTSLTVSSTSDGTDGCSAGQTTTYTLNKQ